MNGETVLRRWPRLTWAFVAWNVLILGWLLYRGPTPPCQGWYGDHCWPPVEGPTTIVIIWLVIGGPLLAAVVSQEYRRKAEWEPGAWPPVWALTALSVTVVVAVLVTWGPLAPTILPISTGPIRTP